MKRLALIALFCLLNSVSVTAGVFSDTKALAEQGHANAQGQPYHAYMAEPIYQCQGNGTWCVITRHGTPAKQPTTGGCLLSSAVLQYTLLS